jgi:glycosyltransferase involved in cell wall biosynthesis
MHMPKNAKFALNTDPHEAMKLLLLADANSIHTRKWVKSLYASGIEIFLFSRDQCIDDYFKTMTGVTVYGYADPELSKKRVRQSFFSRFFIYIPLIKTLRKKIKAFSPDLVHAHFASIYGLYGALCGFQPRLLSVWGSDVYEIPRKSLLNALILRFVLAKTPFIFSTSHAMARQTSRFTSKTIQVIPFGVDTRHFCKLSGNRDEKFFTIGTVKSLHPRYGIDILMDAFAILVKRHPGRALRLLIAGEGNQREILETRSRKAGLEELITFCGKVPHQEVPALIARMDVFVALSRQESFGVAAVEAMACECPVVVSDAEGFCEVVKDGETGFIVPMENPEAACNAIEKLMDNPSLREKMGIKGRQRVQHLYEWDQNVKAMIKAYEKILNQR